MSLIDYDAAPGATGNYVRIKIDYGAGPNVTVYGWKVSSSSYINIGTMGRTGGTIVYNATNGGTIGSAAGTNQNYLQIRGSNYYNLGTIPSSGYDIPNILGYTPSAIVPSLNGPMSDIPPIGVGATPLPLTGTIIIAELYYDFAATLKVGSNTYTDIWYITDRYLATSGNVPCVRGDSLVEIYDPVTKTVNNIRADNVKSGDLVNSLFRGYVPVVISAVLFGKDENWSLFKKDCLGPNKPSADFYIKGMHPLFINGKEIPACDVPERTPVDENYGKVYTFVTDQREPIKINGLDVMTWTYDDFMSFVDSKGITWCRL